MKYSDFLILCKKYLCVDGITILKTINDNPYRFVGDYRIFSPKHKLVQCFSHSIEIKMGKLLEQYLKNCLEELGAVYLNRRTENNKYEFDQFFKYNDCIVLIEQKIRDDHDSTKKTGQINNYLNKKILLSEEYPTNNFFSFMWFIDDNFTKNKNFYQSNLKNGELVYGKELSSYLNQIFKTDTLWIWGDLLNFLANYRNEVNNEINFNCEDNDTDWSIIENKDVNHLFDNKMIIEQILPILSPNKTIFIKIKEELEKTRLNRYKKTTIKKIEEYLEK